jgi:hypothetical protein
MVSRVGTQGVPYCSSLLLLSIRHVVVEGLSTLLCRGALFVAPHPSIRQAGTYHVAQLQCFRWRWSGWLPLLLKLVGVLSKHLCFVWGVTGCAYGQSGGLCRASIRWAGLAPFGDRLPWQQHAHKTAAFKHIAASFADPAGCEAALPGEPLVVWLVGWLLC